MIKLFSVTLSILALSFLTNYVGKQDGISQGKLQGCQELLDVIADMAECVYVDDKLAVRYITTTGHQMTEVLSEIPARVQVQEK